MELYTLGLHALALEFDKGTIAKKKYSEQLLRLKVKVFLLEKQRNSIKEIEK
ncbi:hypothetical protein OIU80_19415 [Flavobacterium sp. LS1R47]|uniref:Uncharacterized protein n=1 Tax=Flavobacterium frigoritolerans TaxID=2987686 RepID=A0A9X3CA72_9FLAO|nr:hypothetical protein [Flavobacterium frigoritolerans]MCV9934455.1 hypothetical protein [Flavobacterium frigoritolerans]